MENNNFWWYLIPFCLEIQNKVLTKTIKSVVLITTR